MIQNKLFGELNKKNNENEIKISFNSNINFFTIILEIIKYYIFLNLLKFSNNFDNFNQ